MKAVHIIGVPLDLGGNRRGTDMGPSAFRIAGIADQLARLCIQVTDKGDVEAPIPEKKGAGDPKKKYVKEIARVCHKVYQSSLESFAAGAMPIVLGGDHSLGAGSVAAACLILFASRMTCLALRRSRPAGPVVEDDELRVRYEVGANRPDLVNELRKIRAEVAP